MRYPMLALLLFSTVSFADIDPFRELTVVSPHVVESDKVLPKGPWHFGTLVREMLPAGATPKQMTDFVVSWLAEWETVTSINGFPVKPRPSVRDSLICPWINASTGGTDCTGDINLDLAPFRLLAIVNRVDVRKAGTAGEGRFVFAVLGEPTANPIDPGFFPMSFTILVDYALPTDNGQDAKFWAKQWHELGGFACNTLEDCADYRAALEKVTNRFTKRGTTAATPNGNPLIDIRSNEISLGFPWQLREFKYIDDGETIRLKASTVNKTPDISFNNSPKLIQFVQENEAAVMSGKFVIPKDMQGGFADMSGSSTKWKLDGVAETLRFNFAKNTCNGCHNGEASQVPPIGGFYHIDPFGSAGPERLSRFILEQDIPRRTEDLKSLLERRERLARAGGK